jgi:hypothetical protein
MNAVASTEFGVSPLASHSSGPTEDPIIYFTLVDFLIQLLFFGLFLFVVFEYGSGNPGETKEWVNRPEWTLFQDLKEELPFLKGMSELVPADSQQAMLDALRKLKEEGLLEEFLKFATQSEHPLDLIKYCATDPERCSRFLGQCEKFPQECERFAAADGSGVTRMMNALGLGPCLPGGRPLFSIEGHGSGIEGEEGYFVVREIFPAGKDELARANIQLIAGQQLAKDRVRTMFQALKPTDCRHYVDYLVLTDSERMRAIVEQTFLIRRKGSATAPSASKG